MVYDKRIKEIQFTSRTISELVAKIMKLEYSNYEIMSYDDIRIPISNIYFEIQSIINIVDELEKSLFIV
jgi:hypothetical protein